MYEREEENDDFFGLSALEMPDFLWDDINQNDYFFSPPMAENTPTKDCREFISGALREKPNRSLVEEKESSEVKMRRQLFTSEESATSKYQGQISSSSENSWGDVPASNCFNQSRRNNDFHLNHLVSTENRADIVGKKSSMSTPMKLTTFIAYPFSPIKPCGIQGEVTLKNINHMIHSSSTSRADCTMDANPPLYFSPISGKPVIVKTKIYIERGRGSITIMRTKG